MADSIPLVRDKNGKVSKSQLNSIFSALGYLETTKAARRVLIQWIAKTPPVISGSVEERLLTAVNNEIKTRPHKKPIW